MSDKAENRPIATVAVERTFFNLDSDYDYAVPPALADRVRPGVAVEVPFGSGNRLRRGIVLQVFVGINPALKDIARVCDYGTVLDESQIRLARWMKNRYFVPPTSACCKCCPVDSVRSAWQGCVWQN